MNQTNIEWCDVTINPLVGCTKCSPGCDNCYAERFAARLAKNPLTASKYAGVVDADGKWTGKIGHGLTNPHSVCDPHLVPGKGKRVFVGSMGDLFHPNVSDEDLDMIFASMLCDAIVSNPHGHEFVLLTKRADRMQAYLSEKPEVLLARWAEAGDGWIHIGDGDELFSDYAEAHCIPQPGHEQYPNLLQAPLWPLPNVRLMATVCNQEEANLKIPQLLAIPGGWKTGVSVEPLLEYVDLRRFLNLPWHCTSCHWRGHHPDWICSECGHRASLPLGAADKDMHCLACGHVLSVGYGVATRAMGGYMRLDCPWCRGNIEHVREFPLPNLDWVVLGGETGRKARPLCPDWAQDVRDHCRDSQTPFFFKSWGEWEVYSMYADPALPQPELCKPNMYVRKFTDQDAYIHAKGVNRSGGVLMHRVGKKKAGNALYDRASYATVVYQQLPDHYAMCECPQFPKIADFDELPF